MDGSLTVRAAILTAIPPVKIVERRRPMNTLRRNGESGSAGLKMGLETVVIRIGND